MADSTESKDSMIYEEFALAFVKKKDDAKKAYDEAIDRARQEVDLAKTRHRQELSKMDYQLAKCCSEGAKHKGSRSKDVLPAGHASVASSMSGSETSRSTEVEDDALESPEDPFDLQKFKETKQSYDLALQGYEKASFAMLKVQESAWKIYVETTAQAAKELRHACAPPEVGDATTYPANFHELINTCKKDEERVLKPFDGQVFRYMHLGDLQKYQKDVMIVWPTFSSCTYDESWLKKEQIAFGGVAFEIRCYGALDASKSENADKYYLPCLIEDHVLSRFVHQKEVVIPPFCSFRVVNVNKAGSLSQTRIFLETTQFPSVWESIGSGKAKDFEKWAKQNPDLLSLTGNNVSIVNEIAKAAVAAPSHEDGLAGFGEMMAKCAAMGAPMSEVDPATGATPVFTLAEGMAGLDKDDRGTKEALSQMIKTMAKSGANLTIPFKGKKLEELVPDLVSDLEKETLLTSKWQYWVDDRVDGKADGWYDYKADAWQRVSSAYSEWLKDGTVAEMVVRSGVFHYMVCFGEMTQTNQSTGKNRRIRRVVTDEDAFWRLVPGTKRAKEAEEAWREHPLFANAKDCEPWLPSQDPMNGLLNPDDYEKGLEEAWERAKPAGSTVTVKDKLAKLSKQNAPHWEPWHMIAQWARYGQRNLEEPLRLSASLLRHNCRVFLKRGRHRVMWLRANDHVQGKHLPAGRLILLAAALLSGISWCFLSSPEKLPKAKSGIDFNPAVAASAALPALTMLAEDAEAKYGDNRKWSAVLVPLTTLVFPMVGFGSFVLYSFQEDAFWRLVPGTKRAKEAEEAWREHPLFANAKDCDELASKTLKK
eukprot:s1900_g4.t1